MADDKRNEKLSHLQELAVRQLAKGKNLAAAARAVGVSRQTIYRWLSEPAFVAAMNRWRESAVTLAQGQILAGLGDAATTVVKAAREGDARMALALLDKSGAFTPLARQLTDPQQIAREQAVRTRGQRAALDQAELDLLEAEELNALRQIHNTPPTPIRVPPAKKSPRPHPPATSAAEGAKSAGDASEPSGPKGAAGAGSPTPPSPSAPPAPPPTPRKRSAKYLASLGLAVYVPDPEVEKAIAVADALKAKEAEFLEKRRKAEEQQSPLPPPPSPDISHNVSHNISHDVSHDLSHPSHSSNAVSPDPSHPSNSSPPKSNSAPKKIRRAADAIATIRSRVDRYDPYSPGMPEPIDKLDDQFADIWREDRDR